MRTAFFLLLALSLFLTGGCISKSPDDFTEPPEVEEGDVVLINYIQRVKDTGELVATSYEELARDPGVPRPEGYKEAETYGPVNITVGSGLMPTVENALIGMRIGDESEVRIPPEEAYGERLSELIRVIPRVAVLPRIIEVSAEEFNETLEVGDYVELKYWQARVIEVTNEYIALRNEPEEGRIIQTKYGPAAVTTNATHVISVLTPEVNSFVITPFGPARVMDYDDDTVTLDHNHPLAGETLSFLARVEGVEKSK
ncbi:MAG: peptidylprolyl isomerase [Candidatus Hydrothermarchaeaceae archaeon]